MRKDKDNKEYAMRVDLHFICKNQSFVAYYSSFAVTICTITSKEYIVKSSEELFQDSGYLGLLRYFARFGAESCSFSTVLFTSVYINFGAR